MKSTNIKDSGMKDINRKLTYKFMLNGENLPLSDIMDNPTITYDCGLEQYSIGNVYVGELQLTVKNTVFVGYKNTIDIEIHQVGAYVGTRIGRFYVHSVEEQGLTKKIKAYDGFYELNVGYFPSAKHTSTKAIMEDIANKHNIVLNGTASYQEIYKWTYGDIPINNEQLEGKTVLEMLSLVACVHGGSFILDGYGFLKLVQPSLETTSVTFTESEYSTPTIDNITTYNVTKLRVIYSEQVTDDDGTVTDTGYFEVGSGNDVHTLAISNPLLKGKQTQAKTILNQIKLLNGYKRFDTTILLGDYRLEPMDVIAYVKGDTTYKVPIIYMQIVLSHNGLIVRTQSPTLAESKKEFSFKGTITQKIDNVYTDMMQVKEIVANVITVSDLNAINANIENLKAKDAEITNLVADKANINDLNATNANIENLKAKDAEIENLVANKADIEDLNATNANIGNLNADIATINTLLAGNITSENIQSGSITSDRLVIDDGFVKDAMIDTISANKIMSGRIDTGAITIGSEDGKMIIADETIQISDGTNVRVQIGETANGDYALVIWDENGEVMFDATGITENAIKDAIIKDDMISDTANINAQKIDINSLFTAINEDGSHTLNSSKIFLDTQQQTLNIAFNNMTTKQGELEEQTNVLSTELNVQSGKIETLIQNTTVTEDGKTINLKDKVSSITQDLDSITTKVETVESDIVNVSNDVTSLTQRVESAEIKITDDAIVSTVTNSQVFKEIVATSASDIGSRNYVLNSDFAKDTDKWTVDFSVTAKKDYTGMRLNVNYSGGTNYIGIKQTLTGIEKVSSNKWTLSCWYYLDSSNFSDFIKLSIKDNYGDDIIKNIVINPVYGKWTRIVCTGETTKTPKIIAFGANNSCSIYVSKFKLECGGVATDWSPNPTDFDNGLNDAITRIENSETKIEQNAQAIALRATKEEVETINGQVTENTTKIGELQISTDSISATVSENVNKIDTNTEKISKLEMKSDSITMEVQNSVGFSNLLINSAFFKGDYGWTLSEYETEYSYEGVFIRSGDEERHPYLNVKWSSHSEDEPDAKLGAKQRLKTTYDDLSEGKKFSFSCKYYLPNVGYLGRGFAIELVGCRWVSCFEDETLPPEGADIEEVIGIIDMSYEDVVVGEWTTVSKTVTLNHRYKYLYIYPYLRLEGEIEFTDFMAIAGNKLPSDWIASPFDTKEDINSLEEQIIVNTQSIASLQVNTDSISASVQRVEQSVTSSLDGMNQNITSLTNRVDATMSAEDVKIEIQKEIANGTNKVTTNTGFTFNEGGLTIDKSDSEMSTNINENGMVITKNNETVLTANNKGVQAKNLYATTYLIVGNSRFESYRGNRTGCFYVFEPSIEMTDETNVLNEEEGEE